MQLSDLIKEPLPKYNFRKATANEFDALEDDGFRYELIDGVITLLPFADYGHNRKNLKIASRLERFLEKNLVGEVNIETEVKLSNTLTYRPDIIVTLIQHLDIIQNGTVTSAPDIVIEVLSKSTKAFDLGKKAEDYFSYGVKEYWAVDGDEKCIYFNIRGSQTWESSRIIDELHSTVLKGFVLNLKEIF